MIRLLGMGDTQIGVGGPDRLPDQEAVLDRIAETAIAEGVSGVLHGGDVFEGPAVTPEQLDVFARFVEQLRNASIPVLAISGNGKHDQAMRAPTGLGIFSHIPGIAVETRSDVHPIGGVAVAALPWAHMGRLVAARDGGDRDQVNVDGGELLLRIAADLRDDCAHALPDMPAVLLLHWSISGASLPTELPVDAMKEPIVPLAGLQALGFDAIVASHIHKPQWASEGSQWNDPFITGPVLGPPAIFYTGSPQPHNHGEAGYEHGVWILELDPDRRGPGSAAAKFIPVESRRFVTVDYDPTLSGMAVDVGGAIVRLRYTATREEARRIDDSAVRQALLDAGAHKVKIEPTIIREERARSVEIHETLSERDALDLYIAQREELAPIADRLRARLDRYVTETLA